MSRIVLILVAILVPGLASGNGESARHEAELKALRERVEALNREQASDRRQQDGLRTDIERAEKALSKAASELRRAQSEVAAQRRQVEAARAEQVKAKAQVEIKRDDLAQALRASYMAGNPGRLQMLLQSSGGDGADRLDADAAVVAAALQTQVRDLQATIEQLRVAEAFLKEEQAALEHKSQVQKQRLAALQKAQKARRGKLETLRQRSVGRETQIAQAKAEESRLQKLLESLRQALRESPMKYESGVPFKSQKGRLPWPLRGKLLAGFGAPKHGGPLTWSGWWIESAAGAPVRAVADGRVVYVGWVQRYGLLVIVDHPGPYLTLYGHLQESVAEVGETLKAGTQLGTAGNSGGQERNGVYFEIRQGTNAIDPRPWLAR